MRGVITSRKANKTMYSCCTVENIHICAYLCIDIVKTQEPKPKKIAHLLGFAQNYILLTRAGVSPPGIAFDISLLGKSNVCMETISYVHTYYSVYQRLNTYIFQ